MTDEGPWRVLTNTMNLQAFASRRLIGPPQMFDKWYTDPSSEAGQLVLLRGSAAPAMVKSAVQEEDGLDPVLIVLTEGVGPADGDRFLTTTSVIPFAEVEEAVVPDDGVAGRLRQAAFSDVRMDVSIRVDPELFDGDPLEPRMPEPVEPFDHSRPGRLGGAWLTLLHALGDASDLLDDVITLLGGDLDAVPRWIPAEEGEIFSIVRDFVAGLDAGRRPPRRALTGLRKEVASTTSDLAEDAGRHVDRIAEVLKGSAEPGQFREGGIMSLKGLLVTLLRPTPNRLLDGGPGDFGADGPTWLTAAYLTGMLNGRARVPLALRPREMDDWIARREASWINDRLDNPDWFAPAGELATRRTRAGISIESGDAQLWAVAVREPTIADLLVDSGSFPDDREREVWDLLEERGWHDLVVTRWVNPTNVHVDTTEDGLVVEIRGGESASRIDVDALVRRLREED